MKNCNYALQNLTWRYDKDNYQREVEVIITEKKSYQVLTLDLTFLEWRVWRTKTFLLLNITIQTTDQLRKNLNHFDHEISEPC